MCVCVAFCWVKPISPNFSPQQLLKAHDNGRKYLATAHELSELMVGRMSYGRDVPVLTIEKPVAIQKGQQGWGWKDNVKLRSPTNMANLRKLPRWKSLHVNPEEITVVAWDSGHRQNYWLHKFVFQLS